jgi:hypothetical protein
MKSLSWISIAKYDFKETQAWVQKWQPQSQKMSNFFLNQYEPDNGAKKNRRVTNLPE